LGSVISSDRDVETDINVRLGKAATIFPQLNKIWQSSSLSQNVKLKLYMSTVVATALYASETWKSTTRIQNQDTAQTRCIRSINEISINEIFGRFWVSHGKTRQRMKRCYKGQDRDVFRTLWQKEDFDLQDKSSVYLRSAKHTAPWIGHQTRGGGRRKRGRPKKTWQRTFKEDLQLRGISWCEVEAGAAEHTRC